MSELLDKVPAEIRWVIATKGLTGACSAYGSALKGAIGEEKYNDFVRSLWHEAGKGAKEFADNLGLAAGSAAELESIIHLLAATSMGPELNVEVIEATADKCVGRASGCPWFERWKELGLDFDYCSAGHQAWGDGATEILNPDFVFKLTKNMVRGDSHCEWVIERKT